MPKKELDKISKCKGLSERIRTFIEINLDYYFFNENVYHFGQPDLLPMYSILDQNAHLNSADSLKENKAIWNMIKDFSKRLFTVCLSNEEYPYISHQDSSLVAEAIAKKVEKKLANYFKSGDKKRIH